MLKRVAYLSLAVILFSQPYLYAETASVVTQTARDYEATNTEYHVLARASAGDFEPGDSDFYIRAWVNAESLGTDRIIVAKWTSAGSANEYQLAYIHSGTQFRFIVSNTGSNVVSVLDTAVATPATATRYLVEAKHDATGNVIGIAVNNSAFNTTAHTTGVYTSPDSDFVIGGQDATSSVFPWDGTIDNVGYATTIPTDAQRDVMYRNGDGLEWEVMPTEIQNLFTSYWVGAEISGDLIDVKSTNDLTDTATVLSTTGGMKYTAQKSVDLESTSSMYYNIADNSDLSGGSKDMAWAIWTNLETSSATTQMVLGKWAGTSTREYFIQTDGVDSWKVGVNDSGSGGADATATVTAQNTGEWGWVYGYHDNGTEIGISLNDGTASTTAHLTGIADTAGDFELGRNKDAASQYYDGKISQAIVWSGGLPTAAEKTAIYNGGKGITYKNYVDAGHSTTNIVAWWSADDAGNLVDYISGYTLTANNTPVQADGVVTTWNTSKVTMSGRDFEDGDTEYFTTADSGEEFSFGSGTADSAFSAGYWTKPESSTTQPQIMGKWAVTGSSHREWGIWHTSDDDIRFVLYDQSAVASIEYQTSTTAISDGSWSNIICTYDGSANVTGQTIYVDGSASSVTDNSSGTYTAMENGNTLAFEIGRIEGGSDVYYDGVLQGAWVIAKELSSAEVTAIYNNGKGRPCSWITDTHSETVACWDMNETEDDIHDYLGVHDGVETGGTIASAAGAVEYTAARGSDFEADNDEVLSITDNTDVSIANGTEFAIGGWFRFETLPAGGQHLAGVWYSSNAAASAYLLWMNSATPTLQSDSGGNPAWGSSLTTGTWYFIVGGYDGTNGWIEVNRQTRVTNGTYNTADTTGDFLIGRHFDSGVGGLRSSDMVASNVFLYNGGSPTSEVLDALYEKGPSMRYEEMSSLMKSHLVAFWELNEPEGYRLDSHGTNHLTDTNSVLQGEGVVHGGKARHTPDTSEILWYKLDDNLATTNVIDSAFPGFHATLNGGDNTSTKNITGKSGDAFDFNGTDDYVELKDIVEFVSTSGYSMSFWLNLDATTALQYAFCIADSDDTSNTKEFILGHLHTDNKWYFNLDRFSNENQQHSTTGTFDENSGWVFIVALAPNDGTAENWIDGSQDGTSSITGGIDDITLPHTLTIGNYWHNGSYSNYTNGQIDDVRIFDHQLTSNDIAKIYNCGDGTTESLADITAVPSCGGGDTNIIIITL